MTEKTINCAECGNSFTYTPNPNYTDRRKYCTPCGVKKNEEWLANLESTKDIVQEPVKGVWPIPEDKPKTNGFKIKLTEENIRIGALHETQIWYGDRDVMEEDFWNKVKEFEEYIRNGK